MKTSVEVRGVNLPSVDGRRRPTAPINFSLKGGDRCVLLGSRSSPASRVLPLLSGLTRPETGDVYVLGASTRHLSSEIRQHIGYASGEVGMPPSLTPIDALIAYSALYGMSSHDASAKAKKILRRLQIDVAEDRQIGLLLPKVQRLVAIAAALLCAPKLLLLDHIDLGLSNEDQKDIWNRLHQVIDAQTTVVAWQKSSVHVERFFSWFILFHQGEILGQGSPKATIEQEVGEAIIDFPIRPGDLEYYVSRLGTQFTYQVVSQHLRVFLKQRSQGNELARLIPSAYYQLRPASFSDLEAKLKGGA